MDSKLSSLRSPSTPAEEKSGISVVFCFVANILFIVVIGAFCHLILDRVHRLCLLINEWYHAGDGAEPTLEDLPGYSVLVITNPQLVYFVGIVLYFALAFTWVLRSGSLLVLRVGLCHMVISSVSALAMLLITSVAYLLPIL